MAKHLWKIWCNTPHSVTVQLTIGPKDPQGGVLILRTLNFHNVQISLWGAVVLGRLPSTRILYVFEQWSCISVEVGSTYHVSIRPMKNEKKRNSSLETNIFLSPSLPLHLPLSPLPLDLHQFANPTLIFKQLHWNRWKWSPQSCSCSQLSETWFIRFTGCPQHYLRVVLPFQKQIALKKNEH